MKKFVALLLAVLMIFSLAACGTKSDDSTKTVYLIIKNMGASYWAVLQRGAQKAQAENKNLRLIVQGIQDEAAHEKQVEYVQNAVSAGADAIVIAVSDSKALRPEVIKASEAGIPIILVDTMIAEWEDYNAAYVTDNVAAGRQAAETLIAKLTAKNAPAGTVAIAAGGAGSQTIIDRMNGFKEYWTANADAKWVIHWDEVIYNDGSQGSDYAVTVGKNYFSAYDDLIAVVGTNNTPTVGLCKALVEDNVTNLTLVGFDLSPEIEALIVEGKRDVATMMQAQFNMGYLGVQMAFDLASGKAGPDPKLQTTPMFVVDKSNLSDPTIQEAAGK